MQLSIDTPIARLGLAVATAAVAAALAAGAFDDDSPQPPTASPDAARPRPVAPPAPAEAARAPGVLDRVLVRPPRLPAGGPGLDDGSTEAVVVDAPAADSGMQPRAAAPPPDRPASAAERERPPSPRRGGARATIDTPDAALARRLNREAIELIDAGRPGAAIAPLEQAASVQPNDAEVLGNLGYAYMLVGDYAAARDRLRRALASAPNRSATWINLGQTYAELGQRDLAIDAVAIGYRHSTRKASVRAALLAAASGSRYSPRWREAAGLALARIDDG